MGVYNIINLKRTIIKSIIAKTVINKTIRWNYHLRFQFDFITRMAVYKIINDKDLN